MSSSRVLKTRRIHFFYTENSHKYSENLDTVETKANIIIINIYTETKMSSTLFV